MTSREAAKYYWNAMKDKPPKEKLCYLLGTYWGYLAAGIVILAVIIGLATGIAGRKEQALVVYCLNAQENDTSGQSLSEDFLENLSLDPEKYDASLLAMGYPTEENQISSASGELQAFYTRLMANEVDVIAAGRTVQEALVPHYCQTDLREVFSGEELAVWADYLVYADGEALRACWNSEDTTPVAVTFLDSPEGMTDPIPVALKLPDNSPLKKAFTFQYGEVLISLTQVTARRENAESFLRYAMGVSG